MEGAKKSLWFSVRKSEYLVQVIHLSNDACDDNQSKCPCLWIYELVHSRKGQLQSYTKSFHTHDLHSSTKTLQKSTWLENDKYGKIKLERTYRDGTYKRANTNMHHDMCLSIKWDKPVNKYGNYSKYYYCITHEGWKKHQFVRTQLSHIEVDKAE